MVARFIQFIFICIHKVFLGYQIYSTRPKLWGHLTKIRFFTKLVRVERTGLLLPLHEVAWQLHFTISLSKAHEHMVGVSNLT